MEVKTYDDNAASCSWYVLVCFIIFQLCFIKLFTRSQLALDALKAWMHESRIWEFMMLSEIKYEC